MQTSERVLSSDEERNKAVVLEYYRLLCGDWNFNAASQFLGAYFVQHNPTIADGRIGLSEWVARRPPFTHDLRTDIRRVLVDGDFVVLHTVVGTPAGAEVPDMVIADFFRLEDHKVVEHWDVIQPVPRDALHGNGIA